MGPLGDQIVRGEMAAPTGRNKDRARMDEDEVRSSFSLECSLMKCCPTVLNVGAFIGADVRKTNRTVH